MRRLTWSLSIVLLVAGCGSSGRVSSPGSTSTTRGGDITSTTLQPPSTRGLRGVPVGSFSCPPPVAQSGSMPVLIEAVQAFRLCPLEPTGNQSEGITIDTSNAVFEVLLRALSAADTPSSPGQICPAYADLAQVVLARTSGTVYQVSIPTDACKHYQRDALDALNRARGN